MTARARHCALQVVNVLQRDPQVVHEGGPHKGKLAFPWGHGVVFTRITRNRDRFPSDFLFQLTADEKTEVVANCDHLQNLKFSKALPLRLPSTEPPKRPIGFLTHEDKKTPKASTLTKGRKAP